MEVKQAIKEAKKYAFDEKGRLVEVNFNPKDTLLRLVDMKVLSKEECH